MSPERLKEAYDLLEIQPTEDLAVVKAAYKRLALIHHPDRNSSADGEQFKAVSAAYESICKHVKGRDEVDLEDPDFQVLFELFHLFNFIGSQAAAAMNAPHGYASGGSSCEGDSEDAEPASSDSEDNESRNYTDGADGDDSAGTEEHEDGSDWEVETPGVEESRSDPRFGAHICHAGHGMCRHNVGSALPRFPLTPESAKPEHQDLLKKHNLQSGLAGGKKRVETDKERKIRVKLLLVEQEIARERGKLKLKKRKKLRDWKGKEQEAAARRAEKNAKKRALNQQKAAAAKEAARAKLLTAQNDRSKLFEQLTACAKLHDDKQYYTACEVVKQAIIDKDIAVTGCERLSGLETDDTAAETDRAFQETTLLHLAVQASDPDLAAWLCERGARADEHDSAGFTPLHRALENGDKGMLDYFFQAFPPFDATGNEISTNMQIYEPINKADPSTSLVMLATLSGDAEVVDYVIDCGSLQEVGHCYRFAQTQIRQARGHQPTVTAWKAVQQMLEQKPGFSPPPEVATRPHGRPHYSTRSGQKWHPKRKPSVSSKPV